MVCIVASLEMNKALEHALGKVLRLPQEQQDVAAELLEQVAATAAGPYELSADERTLIEAALARARLGEFASENDVDALLRQPWRSG